jgi:hypothetical protein
LRGLADPAHGGRAFQTNQTRVPAAVARDPHSRVRDIAKHIGITERAVQQIVTDVEDAGCFTRSRTNPAPERASTTWADFSRSRARALVACGGRARRPRGDPSQCP